MWNSRPSFLSRMVPPELRAPLTAKAFSVMTTSTASLPLTSVVGVVSALVDSSSSSPQAARLPARANAMTTAA